MLNTGQAWTQKKKTPYPAREWCVCDMILVCILWFLWRKMSARYRDCTIFSSVLSSYIQYGAIIVRYLGTFRNCNWWAIGTVYPKKYAHGFVVLCFVVVMQSFIMNSHEVFIHIHQGCFAGTGAIVRLLQCQWSKPDGCGKISQCITTTKHSKAKTVCIFLGIYCNS